MNITLKIIISLVICYFAYKFYQQKQLYASEINSINGKTMQSITITPETIFVFDIDGVILNHDIKKICKMILHSPKTQLFSILLYPRLIYHIYNLKDDQTTEEVLDEIVQADPEFKSCIEIAYKLSYAKKEISGTCDLIRTLKQQNYKLLILSNETADGMNVLTKEHPIFKLFDDMFLTTSADNYLKKPHSEFYKKFLTWINSKNIDPKNLIFIDDKIQNVVVANEEGIPSVVFTNINELKKTLFKI